MLHIVALKHLGDKKIWVEFDDGVSGSVDLEGTLVGPMFEPLNESTEFAKVYIDPELETIAWPNGADFAPEFVKELMLRQEPSQRHG